MVRFSENLSYFFCGTAPCDACASVLRRVNGKQSAKYWIVFQRRLPDNQQSSRRAEQRMQSRSQRELHSAQQIQETRIVAQGIVKSTVYTNPRQAHPMALIGGLQLSKRRISIPERCVDP